MSENSDYNYENNGFESIDLKEYNSKVFIGNDVTASKPQGPVSVENGTLQINYQDKTFIKNNFQVKKGAKLKIQN